MALVLADRVRETTNTAGTGTVTLLGPYAGYQAFSVIGNGNSTYYAIVDPATGAWEVGLGTYTLSGTTLTRAVVLSSSNGGALVNFQAGTKDVILTQPAGRAVYVDGSDIIAANGATVPNSLLANNSLTVGSTNIALGATATTLAGLTSVTSTSFTGNLTGNASTVTNGVYTSGDQTIGGTKTFTNTITGSVTGTASNVTGTVAIANGGTGSTTALDALVALGVQTSATGSEIISTGTTAQRDGSPQAGYFRFNTSTTKFEGYNGSAWGQVGGGATGGGSDAVFIENDQVVTASYSIPSGKNAGTFGPITINSGVTVTVPSGSVWTVV